MTNLKPLRGLSLKNEAFLWQSSSPLLERTVEPRILRTRLYTRYCTRCIPFGSDFLRSSVLIAPTGRRYLHFPQLMHRGIRCGWISSFIGLPSESNQESWAVRVFTLIDEISVHTKRFSFLALILLNSIIANDIVGIWSTLPLKQQGGIEVLCDGYSTYHVKAFSRSHTYTAHGAHHRSCYFHKTQVQSGMLRYHLP